MPVTFRLWRLVFRLVATAGVVCDVAPCLAIHSTPTCFTIKALAFPSNHRRHTTHLGDVHACVRACVRVRVRAYVHARVRAYVRARVRAYVRVCVRACVRACVHVCGQAGGRAYM